MQIQSGRTVPLSSENDQWSLFVVRIANVCLPRCNLIREKIRPAGHLLLGEEKPVYSALLYKFLVSQTKYSLFVYVDSRGLQ